jgi:hypothetical protein
VKGNEGKGRKGKGRAWHRSTMAPCGASPNANGNGAIVTPPTLLVPLTFFRSMRDHSIQRKAKREEEHKRW